MDYFYPLWLYTGLGGLLLLLGVELFPRFHPWRKPLAAAWLTGMTVLWLAGPSSARWLISLWMPSAVLTGAIVMDLTPPLWQLGLALGLALSATAWVELTERRPAAPLVGFLALVALAVTWLGLASGSLVTTLATWAMLDLLVAVTGLMSGGESERVTLGASLQGIASLLLWGIFLLLSLQGVSLLWWLMQPSEALRILLLLVALGRVGLYPFHLGLPRRPGLPRLLHLQASLGPLLGLGLLYRLLTLPGALPLPGWVILWGAIALVWGGVMAWAAQGTATLLWVRYGLLGVLVAGAAATGSGSLLMAGAAAWLGAMALLCLRRGYDRRQPFWAWPFWLAGLFLLGVPPAPGGELYRAAWLAADWGARLLLLVGGVLVSAALFQALGQPARGRVTPPEPWQRAGLVMGMGLPLGALVGAAVAPTWDAVGLGLWLGMLLLAGALSRYGAVSRRWFRQLQVLWDMLDGQWFYRALWRGAENVLGVVRNLADVVEGNGALLWSLLVLLLILWVVMNR